MKGDEFIMFSSNPITLDETKKEFEALNRNINHLLNKLGDECENVQSNRNDLDESFLRSQYYFLADKLDDIKRRLDYLSKPIVDQGYLRKNNRGRFELPSGQEFTSGSTCEILYTDEDDEQYWIVTTIEHRYDYYATALGVEKPLDGMMVRIRR